MKITLLDSDKWQVRWLDAQTSRWRNATFDTEREADTFRTDLRDRHEQQKLALRDRLADLDRMLTLATGQLDQARATVIADNRSEIGQLYRRCDSDQDQLNRVDATL